MWLLVGYQIFHSTLRQIDLQLRNKLIVQHGFDGKCYNRVETDLVPLPHFGDDCQLADIVKHFYIGRTQTAGTVRMGPKFHQKDHDEWFINAIGKLRIGW